MFLSAEAARHIWMASTSRLLHYFDRAGSKAPAASLCNRDEQNGVSVVSCWLL